MDALKRFLPLLQLGCFTVSFALVCCSSEATVFYVAPNGDDTASGTTLNDPLATIREGVSRLHPGDTLEIRAGTYTEGNISIPRSGSPGFPITIKAYDGEEHQVVLSINIGTRFFALSDGFGQPPGSGHYIFRGLLFRNAGNSFDIGSLITRHHDILIDNVGIGVHNPSGGGLFYWWASANVWAYNNTLVHLTQNETPVIKCGDSDDYMTVGTGFFKNNIFVSGYNSGICFWFDPYRNSYKGDHNIWQSGSDNAAVFNFKVNGGGTNHNFGWTQYQNYMMSYYAGSETNSLWADPEFAQLNVNDDSLSQDLRLTSNSPAIDAGEAFDTSDPDDYPTKIEEFLAAFNHFNDFALLTIQERNALLQRIRNAYLVDSNDLPRDATPDIGAYEYQSACGVFCDDFESGNSDAWAIVVQ